MKTSLHYFVILDKWFLLILKKAKFFSSANLIGIVLYLLFVFQAQQVLVREGRIDYDFEDSLNVLFTAFPIFLVCQTLNLVWLGMIVVGIFKTKDYRMFKVFLLFAGMWIVAVSLGALHVG